MRARGARDFLRGGGACVGMGMGSAGRALPGQTRRRRRRPPSSLAALTRGRVPLPPPLPGEGGYRVPCLVRWPGKFLKARVLNGILSHADWWAGPSNYGVSRVGFGFWQGDRLGC